MKLHKFLCRHDLPTQMRFPIGGERVTCHGSRFTNYLGKHDLNFRLARDQVVHL